MAYDIEMIREFYSGLRAKQQSARSLLGRPMTLAEKILYSHLYDGIPAEPLRRMEDYAFFRPDRVAMQDATAQMALLQFMNAGREKVAVPTTVHCDHLICARQGAGKDLPAALKANSEVYGFLRTASSRYGIGYWQPGAGIIHQIVLENYAFPGGMMVGTDSHTPNAGGLGMLAVGVGGADAVDVMAGMEWELKVPKLIGVHLTGRLSGWASPKDVILYLAGLLTVKGGTNAIIEYFGEGADSIPCTGKATICNMGAEVGATCSVFPFDGEMAAYLRETGRDEVAALAEAESDCLTADAGVLEAPEKYFDRVIELDLSSLEPYVNGPFTPDAACPMSRMAARVAENGYPEALQVALIGSCTNSSYGDLKRAAAVARWYLDSGRRPAASLIVNPGSAMIYAAAERDGIIATLEEAGAVIMTNACGPCIGQWERYSPGTETSGGRNSIVTTFNRNFAKRADGNPGTHAFIVSPEVAVALAFEGRLWFDTSAVPAPAELAARLPERVRPFGDIVAGAGYVAPVDGSPDPVICEGSERLQRLEPFAPWDGKPVIGAPVLIKVAGKCTTDHISMAGPWLRYRGHLANISANFLLGAVNAFTGEAGRTQLRLPEGVGPYWAITSGAVTEDVPGKAPVEAFRAVGSDGCTSGAGESGIPDINVAEAAKAYRDAGCGSIVVAEDNYGEGSSREHAAMEPRYLGVKAVIAKSFARIHETNLKKQGVLALTFVNPSDYDKVREDDLIDIPWLADWQLRLPKGVRPQLDIILRHSDGSTESIAVRHTYNNKQISWFRAGSALNNLKNE